MMITSLIYIGSISILLFLAALATVQPASCLLITSVLPFLPRKKILILCRVVMHQKKTTPESDVVM